jgi:hypothetical protein
VEVRCQTQTLHPERKNGDGKWTIQAGIHHFDDQNQNCPPGDDDAGKFGSNGGMSCSGTLPDGHRRSPLEAW